MDNQLIIGELVVGEGAEAQDFNKVVVNYTGMLDDGSVFDSSLKPGREPFMFTLGVGSVIKGWDQGVKGMKVGGKRKLIIPPELGYGVQRRKLDRYGSCGGAAQYGVGGRDHPRTFCRRLLH